MRYILNYAIILPLKIQDKFLFLNKNSYRKNMFVNHNLKFDILFYTHLHTYKK